MTTYDRTKLAAMAAALRSGGRRTDPETISITRVREIGAQSLALAAALGSDAARRQSATPTRSEQAEIDRVVAANPEWFGTTEDTDR